MQPLEHHPTESQGQTANVGILDHFSMAGGCQAENVDKSIDNHCEPAPPTPQQCFSLPSLQAWGSGAKHIRARPTLIEPQQCFSLPSLQAWNKTCLDSPHPAVILLSFLWRAAPTPPPPPPGRPRPTRPKDAGHAHYPRWPGVILTFL